MVTGRTIGDTARQLWQSVPWRWIALWLLLPNAVILAMWPVGGPVMRNPLVLFGIVALLAAQLSAGWAKRVVLVVIMMAIMTYYVCLSFNLPIWGVRYLPQFMSEVKPWRAPFYLTGCALFLVALFVVLRYAPRVPRFASFFPMLFALGAVYGVAEVDAKISEPTSSSYSASPGPGDPFTPATHLAQLDRPQGGTRNVVIVLVEALGMPAGQREREQFADSWNFRALEGRYDIRHGAIRYYGSTTNAELRELCGRWGYYDRFDFKNARCLPEVYHEAGYETAAIHSFGGALFERWRWYPELKFDRIDFAPQLHAQGVRDCGGLFPGACDDAIPALIGKRIKAASKPQMIYWLTLNSHLPVVTDDAMGTDLCATEREERRWTNQDLCRVFMVHDRLARAIRELAADPSLPPTDFLIVGDHMPPFFDRESRQRFDGRRVPWFYLRSRAGDGATNRGAR